jgi:putative membrane protein
MRVALVLSLLIAILAVVFALQNPAYMDVNLGPFDITGSTALILMVTFCVGVIVGILATTPAIVKRKKRIRQLEKHAADVRTEETRPIGETRPGTTSDYGSIDT